ncbi:MAG: LysM peptidoglycan-binding domain-containing protein [Myxococcota bacterium]|nr:LysM peptidoglycan-binding domain-containing protein [Myxococcota bacterium]
MKGFCATHLPVPWLVAALLCTAATAQADDLALDAILDNDAYGLVTDFDATRSTLVLRHLLLEDFAFSPSPARQVSTAATLRPPIRPMRSMTDTLETSGLLLQLEPIPGESALAHHSEEAKYDIPLAEHPLVDQYIDYFTGRGRKFFGRWLSRADRYAPIMVPILEEMGLPRDTLYLAMIESGFNAKAYSSAAASGFWQFISSTGKRYGLRQTFWVDERRDFIKATRSAGRFLKHLHRQFGDWHLAWAGYNAGGGRIRRALAKYGVNDYWQLISHKQSLAKETRHYVPKLIAAAIVAKNRERYGFTSVKPLAPLSWDELKVDSPTDLRVVAKAFDLKVSALETLNPAWKRRISPPGRTSTFRVPAGHGPEIAAWLAARKPAERLQYSTHTVRSGDTLSEIAQAYGSTVSAIKSMNHIRSSRTLRLGQTLIIPEFGERLAKKKSRKSSSVARKKLTKPKAPRPTESAKASPQKHRVQQGETLWSIARRYQTSVKSIKQLNGRRTNTIRVGELLRVL